MKVDGMNVVVTGGSQGLGREIAEHFLRAGANVAICARDENLLERTQEELEGLAGEGRRLVSAACDVSR
ncbi:MAG: SDR family NAD(P)-dependent oxidoreductase, partial [Chthoniobacterales bacterium]